MSALSGLSSLKSLYLGKSGLTWRSILSMSRIEIFIVCFLLELYLTVYNRNIVLLDILKLSSLEILNLNDNGLNESESIFWRIKG